ncbi:MAG: four-carbon acid sugar kinase family protein [Prevotella sp.]|nr:four-carbon acid sugar kinase family protein [Prevotella sp.]MDY4625374.1 four-carbon acid sugar kinase family protein [Prevotella sp.]MDY5259138.1 four-carbon acid sugar kinase family protein [Prevotella sp.]
MISRRILVVADDITGAVEVAGIALRYGLRTHLAISMAESLPNADVIVVATNTRSENEAEAARTIRTVCSKCRGNDFLLFKKTDSVLRGHIALELHEMMLALDYRNALLIAQNPSRERIISGGRYLVEGRPLHLTDFSHDPEYPAWTDDVVALLHHKATSLSLGDTLLKEGNIYVADASSWADICLQLHKATLETLLAGGADAFEALLCTLLGHVERQLPTHNCSISISPFRSMLIFCGSTQSKLLHDEPFVRQMGIPECIVPLKIDDKQSIAEWKAQVSTLYQQHHRLIVHVGKRPQGGSSVAVALKGIMADVACRLTDVHRPSLLIVEGGATAYAILQQLGWTDFSMYIEYAPGIVSMRHHLTEIILKPGSYPWGSLFSSCIRDKKIVAIRCDSFVDAP